MDFKWFFQPKVGGIMALAERGIPLSVFRRQISENLQRYVIINSAVDMA